MECAHCSRSNAPSAVCCQQCGVPLSRSCGACGRSAPADATFCGGCGLRLAVRHTPASVHEAGARRMLTVLFSDLSGYTAMNEVLEPEEVAEVLGHIKDEAQRIIHEHGGLVNQFVGDEVIALFGLPRTHEDDSCRAVSAALALHAFIARFSAQHEQRLGRPLHLHTGITTGLVLAQRSDVLDGRYRVTGDSVNTAARLLSRAGQGEILIGASTCRLVAPYFRLEELEPLPAKGKTHLVLAFRVLGPTARTSFEVAQRRGLTAYTGRGTELRELGALLTRVAEGVCGFATVSGQPGLGKSRLFHELEAEARSAGMLVLRGRCDAFGKVAPYQPFLHVLRDALSLGEEDSPEAALEQVHSSVRLLEDPELEGHLPHLLHLLSLKGTAPTQPPGQEGERMRQALAEAIRVFVRALARRQPVVLLLEDWHWADAASDAVLRHLARGIERCPVVLLVNHRDHYTPDWGVPRPLPLRLRAFERADTAAMVRSLLDGGESLVDLVHERTGGNPFFIEEVCRGLRERGSRAGRLDVPDSVQAMVRARLDRLGAEATEVLVLAAVVGPETPLRLLERLVAFPERLPACLAQLEAADMLWPSRGAREPVYCFNHVIIQEVAYESLMLRQRRELHALVGRALEELHAHRLEDHLEALAHHHARAERFDKAALYAQKAGEKAASSYALEEARRQYERALEFLQRLEETPELLRRRVAVAIRWGKVGIYKPSPRQVTAMEACYAIARRLEDAPGAVRCGYWTGGLQHALGNQDEAVWHYERVLPLARESGDERMEVQLYLNLVPSFTAATEYPRALAFFERAVSRGGLASHRDQGMPYALGFLGLLRGDQGDFPRGHAHLAEALRLTRQFGWRSLENSVEVLLGMVQVCQGDWSASQQTARRARVTAEQMDTPYVLAMSQAIEGMARAHLQGGDAPLAQMREAVARMEESETRLLLSWSYACLAECLALADQPEEARLWAHKALGRASAWDRTGDVMAHRALGVAAGRGPTADLDRALPHLEKGVAVARQKNSLREESLCLLRMAEVLGEQGSAELARPRLEQARAGFETMGMPWYRERAETLQRTLAGG